MSVGRRRMTCSFLMGIWIGPGSDCFWRVGEGLLECAAPIDPVVKQKCHSYYQLLLARKVFTHEVLIRCVRICIETFHKILHSVHGGTIQRDHQRGHYHTK